MSATVTVEDRPDVQHIQKVPLGYEQTELGVISEDWDVESCDDLCSKIQDGTHFSPKMGGVDFLYVTSRNIGFGILDVSSAERIDEAQHRKIYARCDTKKGDLLLTKDGANTGNAAINILDVECSLLSSVAFLRFRSGNDAEFFLQYILSASGQGRIKQLMSGNAITRLTLAKIRNLKLPRPPFQEQRAIAAALSKMDELIGALDKLIAKKRAIKLATMQQLLTGKIRLSGFGVKKIQFKHTDIGIIPNDWSIHMLGDEIARLDTGVSVRSVEHTGIDSDGDSILKTSAVANGKFDPRECKNIDPRDYRRAKLSPRTDSIIISRMNTPDLVGECGYVDQDYPYLFLPDRLWMTRFQARSNICPKWLSYVLSSAIYKRKLREAATGTSGSMKNISQGVLLRLQIPWPDGKEQRAIATVLSEMDAEIAALERRRDKTKGIKQGMMQALLTGRIRFAKPGAQE